MSRDTAKFLSDSAESKGLTFLGAVTLTKEESFAHYESWISNGKHSSMSFLEKNMSSREDPRKILPGARSAVVLGMSYNQGDTIKTDSQRVSQYARLKDYHRVLKTKGDEILRELLEENPSATGKVLVDTAPVLERSLAEKTGSGFIGKNTCFITKEWGSLIFLCEIITTLDLNITSDTVAGCGDCTQCQEMCPTHALDTEYQLDANRCFCYWSVEHRGTIPEEFWPNFKSYFLGCDICQIVCPHNNKAKLADPSLIKIKKLPPLFEIATMDQAGYERMFGGTPMTRAKIEGLKRNALISMAVTDDPRLDEAMKKCTGVSETISQIKKTRCQKP